MGFYGSVYHQVINNFYKAIINNNGQDKKNMIDDEFDSNVEIAANGRMGTLNFDTGNKWINLHKTNEEDIIEIYHGKPEYKEDDDVVSKGFEKIEAEEEQPIEEKIAALQDELKCDLISLDSGDYILTEALCYDEAGHITKKEPQIYQMPVGQALAIEALQRTVGTHEESGSVDLNTIEEKDGDEKSKNHVLGQLEKHQNDIKSLNSYVGDWKSYIDGWDSDSINSFTPTITEIIGSIDHIFNSSYKNNATNSNYNSIAEILGNIYNLWTSGIIENSGGSFSSATQYLGLGSQGSIADMIAKIVINLNDHKGNIDNLIAGETKILNDINGITNSTDGTIVKGDLKVLEDSKSYTNEEIEKLKKTILGEGIDDAYDTLVEIQKILADEEASGATGLISSVSGLSDKLALGTYETIPEEGGDPIEVEYDTVKGYVEDYVSKKLDLGTYETIPEGEDSPVEVEYDTVKEYVEDKTLTIKNKLTLGTHETPDPEEDGVSIEVEYDTVKEYVEDYVSKKLDLGTYETPNPEEGGDPLEVEYTVKKYIETLENKVATLEGKIAALEDIITFYHPEASLS